MVDGLGHALVHEASAQLHKTATLARWASALLAVATVSTALLSVLPEAFNRPVAVPTGIALVALGCSSWVTAPTRLSGPVPDLSTRAR